MEYDQIEETATHVLSQTSRSPEIGIISGTGISLPGLKLLADQKIPYQDIPGFAVPTVSSHSGELIIGTASGKDVAWFRGRSHYYEGLSMRKVALPARVLSAIGGKILIIINAAGGVNLNWQVGDLALITDHINFMQDNPLIGDNDDRLGPRFPDMSCVYDLAAREAMIETAEELALDLRQGVYLALPGPSLETRAEYEMIRRMGADLVGMSTVPEVIAARHSGLRVLGISIVTNVVKPDTKLEETTIDEVIAVADQASEKLGPLLSKMLERL